MGVSGGGTPPGALRDVSVLSVVNILLKRRVMIGGIALTAALLVAAMITTGGRSYRAEASFMEQSRRSGGAAAGLAAQIGLSVGGDGSQSPQFYVDLIASRAILEPLVDGHYRVVTDSGVREGTLPYILGAVAKTPALRREAAIDDLKRRMQTSVTAQTGVVTLRVSHGSAALATEIAGRTLDLLNRFNLERRQTQAKQERQFTEQRLREAEAALREAEQRQQRFLERNRAYSSSPELVFEHDRLRRDVQMKQEIFTGVAQAHEQARVDAIRDTPVITVIVPPKIPARPEPRGLVRWTALSLVAALLFATSLAFLLEYTSAATGSSAEDAAEFRALRREALHDLLQPWRPLGRVLRRRGGAA